MMQSPGFCLKKALKQECPLQVVGVLNAYSALLAQQAGFKALYLSGAGIANAAFGLPDCGMTSLSDLCEETRRLTACTDLPLLVDGDTGFGGHLNTQYMVKQLIRAGAAGAHIEDQVFPKRCGHRPNKQLIMPLEMCERIKAAVDARTDPDFVVMARTDAIASEGIEAAIDRACMYIEAGADMIFAEAVGSLQDYQAFTRTLSMPVLANITEFGLTPLFTVSELKSVDIALILYPLSAFRAMSQAALTVYQTLRTEGSQTEVLPLMQTREDLYHILNYAEFERWL